MSEYLTDRLERWARETPDQPALWFEGRKTSYAELDRLSSQCAHALIAAGVKPGERVAALARNCDDFFILWAGALKARACLNPVNWRLAPPEVAFVVNDAASRVLVYTDAFAGVVEGLGEELKTVTTRVQFEPGGGLDFRSWIGAYPETAPPRAPEAMDDAIQLYTSGTTGLPKGVMLTQANYQAVIDSATVSWANFAPAESVLVAMPVFHVAGANMGMLGLVQGAHCVVLREVDPGVLLGMIETHGVRSCFMAPAVINMVLQHPDLPTTDLSSLKNVYYGASPISEEVLKTAQARLGADFTQLYGLTETIGLGCCLPPEDHVGERLRACGKSSPGVETRIRVDGRDAAIGEVGEIEIRGPCVMKGYWNRPDATAEAIDAEGWFKSGDAAYRDAEGFVYIHDRVKDMIVSGGENVYPAEVENALFACPGVADAAVIGVPDEKWGEAVKGVVVMKPGFEADAAAIIAECRKRIAGYKVPKTIDFIDVLPRNPSGKVLRRELRAPYWEGRARNVG
jgi:acyl-CoA synthetase (AMP-forming)/AMP-acid ligase II